MRTFPEAWSGSSPLARGLLGAPLVLRQGVGIIPARAGFTVRHRGARQGRWDHPRSRGVYPGYVTWVGPTPGSSPLARGLHTDRLPAVQGAGIIPARAGFTSLLCRSSTASRDHPRSRGVYSQPDDKGTNAWGSSPLARGLRVSTKDILAGGRIIPARAGFTRLRGAITEQVRDHPRSRGVYVTGPHPRIRVVGSSPLARGLLNGIVRALDRTGIIPARAGFTPRFVSPIISPQDHPRSRGVYLATARYRPASTGSSPLARGLQRRAAVDQVRTGIIPARAGFTLANVRPPAG